MEEDNNNISAAVVPDFKDLESKLGLKVPESLVRSLAERNVEHKTLETPNAHRSAALKRLEGKMLFLKQEMAHLRAIDVQLMQQLMSINEGIESIRWVMEDKGGVASQEGSLTGSLYSLSDSQDGSSLHGSCSSLNGGRRRRRLDGLDGISVGSYLDTLGEGLPDQPSPTDLVIDGETAFGKSPLKLRVESDEYYCFG
ncbi:LOW QUALITY PROTEIN: hypothetical protein CRUP_025507 [Coryphaenoides rupestris]|nr:LOW QUALITY PROTEIN: hypothetical protein CRUP_025507 [Coryphaenoides rupestris]